MKFYSNPKQEQWPEILRRPSIEVDQLQSTINGIFDQVKDRGDQALIDFTAKFDQVRIKELEVSTIELENQAQKVTAELKHAIEQANINIARFHESQKLESVVIETMPGVKCWRKSLPIECIGIYVPGGSAPLFSTVLMLATPAKIAGCSKIILCTPPDQNGSIHPAIAFAATIAGVDRIFKVGGAQAIAAMTLGTEVIPQVEKIFGPGNQYVTAAKLKALQMGVGIDMPAGPSEVLVIADESSNPKFVAIDLLSQAEHGPDSQVVLLTTDQVLIEKVENEIDKLLPLLPRADIANQALEHSISIRFDSREMLLEMCNYYAPEHLIISVDDVESYVDHIKHAGSVFIGHYTPESAGDYASGTNHTLPTNGYARLYSGVSLDTYVKKTTYQQLTKEGLRNLGPIVEIMAEAEKLDAHKLAVSLRLKEISDD